VSAQNRGISASSSPSGEPRKFFRLSHLRRLRRSEQVAAVCYRIGRKGVEFLLVQTSGGRWIFPKGSTMPGLTHAQAAALEAFEEAGVHGRMEEAPFAQYVRRKGDARDPGDVQGTVTAHLCQVSRLESPQEADRNPTWFSPEKAKRRLLEGRKPAYGAELSRVIDRALIRVGRLQSADRILPAPHNDALQKVHFIDSAWRARFRNAIEKKV
jgi:8-oxo-dGTP pyrophosphatase MutT (NUDIX family)